MSRGANTQGRSKILKEACTVCALVQRQQIIMKFGLAKMASGALTIINILRDSCENIHNKQTVFHFHFKSLEGGTSYVGGTTAQRFAKLSTVTID